MSTKKLAWILAAFLLAGLVVSPVSHGAQPIQGAVGEVSASDGAALGPAGCRYWSALPGGSLSINANSSLYPDARYPRNYLSNTLLQPGGYLCNQENTAAYNADAELQPFYLLVDVSMQDGTGNHIAYYGVSGMVAGASTSAGGNCRSAGCPGTTPGNCLERQDTRNARPAPLTGTYASYGPGGPNTISSIGGLSPVPNVRLASLSNGVVTLQWDDPHTYSLAMKDGAPSPVLGVRLWKNERSGSCTSPSGSDAGWTSVGVFNLGNTTTQIALAPGVACTYFALTVRLVGPGANGAEVETGQQGTDHFVGVNSYPAMLCDDGISCTNDYFDNGLQQCVHENTDGISCDDGNPCTAGDSCSGGNCQPGTPNTDPCDDHNACTVGDVCASSVCVPGAQLDCSDGNACTTDSCDPLAGCQHTTIVCDDSDACTMNQCNPATGCVFPQIDCSDGNVCTDDSCDAQSGCRHVPVPGRACSDLNACTDSDLCDGIGACVGQPITCNDNNECTDDSCNPASGCVYVADDTNFCSDGNPCTVDVCIGGVCSCPASTPPALSTFASTDVPKAISTSGAPTVTSTLVVAGVGSYLYDLDVATFITHTSCGQLQVTVKSPSGTIVTLTSNNGGTNDNVFNGTMWNDNADPGNQAPFPANTFATSNLVTDTVFTNLVPKTTLVPEEAMGAFIGENPNGVWTLTIADQTNGDGGALNAWSMTVQTLPGTPPEAVTSYLVSRYPESYSIDRGHHLDRHGLRCRAPDWARPVGELYPAFIRQRSGYHHQVSGGDGRYAGNGRGQRKRQRVQRHGLERQGRSGEPGALRGSLCILQHRHGRRVCEQRREGDPRAGGGHVGLRGRRSERGLDAYGE